MTRSDKVNQEISDRTLEIFYTLIRGELLSNRKIADRYGMSESAVKMVLYRIREKLHKHLEKEGITL